MSNIGEIIKNFRLLRNMSQRQLGDKLNKTSAVISNWEKGINSPDLDSIERLCHILGCTPNELFGWEESEELKTFLKENEHITNELSKLMKAREELDKQIETITNDLNGKKIVIEYNSDDKEDLEKLRKLPIAIKRRVIFKDTKETPK